MLHVPLGNSLIVSSNLWVLNTFESGGILVAPKTNICTPFICPQQIEIDPTINKLIYISDIFWFNRARLSVCYVLIRRAVATWPTLTSGACLPSPKMMQPLAQFLWNLIHRTRVCACFFFKEMDKRSSLLNQIA